MDGSEPLAIRNAERLAEVFFRVDGSSAGLNSYDGWIVESPSDRFIDGDVKAINKTMRARSAAGRWSTFIEAGASLRWLQDLDTAWELFSLTTAEWREQRCSERIAAALAELIGPYRSLSVSTKILHIKRPHLIPVCDSLVVELIRAPWPAGWTTVEFGLAVIEHLRDQGRANLAELQGIQQYLAGRGVNRSLVRILDALLWSSHRNAWFYPFAEIIEDWRRS